VIFIHLFSLT
jgi:hypothetical protein